MSVHLLLLVSIHSVLCPHNTVHRLPVVSVQGAVLGHVWVRLILLTRRGLQWLLVEAHAVHGRGSSIERLSPGKPR